MGVKLHRPKRLPEKLLQIRTALGVSQTEMVRRLGVEDLISFKEISKYELGRNEPSLIVILQYARVAGISMEVLVDDETDLPAKRLAKLKQSHR